MTGVKEWILLFARLVASEAALGILARVSAKCLNQLVGFKRFGFVAARGFLSVDMRLAGTVTGFAHHHRLCGRFQSRVRRFIELGKFRSVTRPAPIVPHGLCRRARHWKMPCYGRAGRRT